MRLADALGQKAFLGIEKDFLCPGAFHGGGEGKRDGIDLVAFKGEIKVEVIAPFCVRDGMALNETEKFQGLPAIVVGKFGMEV